MSKSKPKELLVEPDGAWRRKADSSEGRAAEWAVSLRVGKSRRRYMLSVSGPSDLTLIRLMGWLGFEVTS